MKKTPAISTPTRNNWLIDLLLLISGLITFLSGTYFLVFAMNGYQGGRNPMYGIIIFFERHTWTNLHIWGSIAMLIVAAIHIPIHWNWIVTMSKRVVKIAAGKSKKMNPNGTFNLVINSTIALSAFVSGFSGIYFLFFPEALHHPSLSNPSWLFSFTTWDLIHTWSSVLMVASAILHFAIHWKWVTKVTTKIFRNIFSSAKN